MKKIFTIAAAAALLLVAGCQKEKAVNGESDGQKCAVTVTLSDIMSKATGISAANEAKFNSAQFFVFDNNGAIEDYKAVTTASSAVLSASAGTKTFAVVLNAKEDLSDASSLAALNAKVTYLKDNALDHFVMVGTKSQAVSGTTSQVEISVKRQVAKIQINKVTTAFESLALKNATFIVDRFYLINAAGDGTVGAPGNPSIWYNEAGWHKGTANPLGAADALTADTVALDLSGNKASTTSHVFYTYPNNFGVHSTVLELAVRIDGKVDYYCIDFTSKGVTSIEPNKTYTVEELVIRHRGNDHDGDGIIDGTADVDCKIKIDDWQTGIAPYVENL